MRVTKVKPNPGAADLLRRYTRLREAGLRALRLLRDMDADRALRLPFVGYPEAVEALRKELE